MKRLVDISVFTLFVLVIPGIVLLMTNPLSSAQGGGTCVFPACNFGAGECAADETCVSGDGQCGACQPCPMECDPGDPSSCNPGESCHAYGDNLNCGICEPACNVDDLVACDFCDFDTEVCFFNTQICLEMCVPAGQCGNGVIETGEDCDPPGACQNTGAFCLLLGEGPGGQGTCNTGDVCVVDELVCDPATCQFPTHLECQGNACTIVPGGGSDLDGCLGEGNLCSDTEHLACENDMCVIMPGGGANEDGCTFEGESCSSGGTHLVCNDALSICEIVPGSGSNQDGCTSDGEACSDTEHLGCVDGMCAILPGGGADQDGCTFEGEACTGGSMCGNDITEFPEQCDGTDDSACPGLCQGDCTCSSPVGQFTNAEWHDLADNEIGESYVNDTVRLFAQTTFSENTIVEFRIWEDDFLLDDPITSLLSSVDDQGIVSVDWEITDDAMLDNGDSEFFFKVNVSDTESDSRDFDDGTYDGILIVHDMEGDNDPPTALISSPLHREIYFNGTSLEFNHSSTDTDNPLDTFEWTIIFNGAVEHTTTEESFTHSFVEPGMRTVTLRATDTQGAWNEDQIAILIVASPYLLTYINQPFHTQIIEQPGQPPTIDYSATDTYIVDILGDGNADNCPDGATCLAGNCPAETNNTPEECTLFDTISVSNTPQGFETVHFNWTFGDGAGARDTFSGLNNASGWYAYSAHSVNRNDAWINLTVGYTPASLEEQVERIFTVGQCIEQGSVFVETDGAGTFIAEHNTINSDWCSGDDGIAGNGNDCCPPSAECQLGVGCVFTDITQCEQYQDQNSCENDVAHVTEPPYANEDYEDFAQTCEEDGGAADINCSWVPGQGCFTDYFCYDDFCTGNDCGTTPSCIEYECGYTYTESECTNGYYTISYTLRPYNDVIDTSGNTNYCGGTPTESEYNTACAREPITVPCGQINFELSFFDYQHALATTLIILLIYSVWQYQTHRRMNQKRKEKHQ